MSGPRSAALLATLLAGSAIALLARPDPVAARAPHAVEGQVSRILRCRSDLRARSLGTPQVGGLEDGVRLPAVPTLRLKNGPDRVWGTPGTVACVLHAADRLRRHDPASAPLLVGDLSLRDGGPLGGHKSHQSGRDADLGLRHLGARQPAGFEAATPETLDADATWSLVAALVETGWIERIFLDRSLHGVLRDAARRAGVGAGEADRIFGDVIRHWPGHRDHLHVRIRARDEACGEGPMVAVAGRDRPPRRPWARPPRAPSVRRTVVSGSSALGDRDRWARMHAMARRLGY